MLFKSSFGRQEVRIRQSPLSESGLMKRAFFLPVFKPESRKKIDFFAEFHYNQRVIKGLAVGFSRASVLLEKK